MAWSKLLAHAPFATRSARELIEVISHSQTWRHLAYIDIRSRYRRTTLGPFWVTLTAASMVLAIAVIYGELLGHAPSTYLPYLTIGLLVWFFISSTLTEGCSSLITAAPLIKSSSLPITFHVMRALQRNLIVFLHNALILVVVWLILRWDIGWEALLAIAGLALLYLFLFGVTLSLALICVRFRDVPPMVGAGLQLMFFASPIIWYPESLPLGRLIVDLNPFTYFLAIIRDPLLNRPFIPAFWFFASLCSFATLLTAVALYMRYRDRVAYWV